MVRRSPRKQPSAAYVALSSRFFEHGSPSPLINEDNAYSGSCCNNVLWRKRLFAVAAGVVNQHTQRVSLGCDRHIAEQVIHA
jgi:hypothetical protein